MSSTTAHTRYSGEIAIIDIGGRISLNDGLGVMREAIKTAVNAGHKNILLNMAGVDYIDSAGLGEMASAYITVANMGGKMKLLHTQDRVNTMLHVTKLYTLLVTYADETVALASFG